jgi:hypothetical protein
MNRQRNICTVRVIPGTPTAFERSAQGCHSRDAAQATLGLRSKMFMNPNGVLIVWAASRSRELMQPRRGWSGLMNDSQGSASRATLGWMMERRWRSAPGEILTSPSQLGGGDTAGHEGTGGEPHRVHAGGGAERCFRGSGGASANPAGGASDAEDESVWESLRFLPLRPPSPIPGDGKPS